MKTIKLLDVKGNEHEYVPVSEKILWLKENKKQYSLVCESEYIPSLGGWKCHAVLTMDEQTYTGDAFKKISNDVFGRVALQTVVLLLLLVY